MQEAGSSTGEEAPSGDPTGFRKKAWASLASTGGMLLVPCAYWTLEAYGPSSRVVVYDYLPFQGAFDNVLAATLGAWLGAWGFRLFRPGRHYSIVRLMAGCLLGGALGLIAAGFLAFTAYTAAIHPTVLLVSAAIIPGLGAWCCGIAMFRSAEPGKRGRVDWLPLSLAATVAIWLIHPQFAAFPKHGTVAEREAWARVNIPQYMSLTRTVEKLPLIQESVGRVMAIAPTSGEQHVAGPTMDGVAMNMAVEVVGDKGAGILRVHCTVDGDTVFEWEPATWTMDGTTTEIATVPNLILRR
jgi:hypothetical protein